MATTPATTSQSPLTASKLWGSWPEYTSLIQDRPECAAEPEVARDLFRTQDPRYLPFIHSFPFQTCEEDNDQRALPEALQSGEFLVALLDIVSDELWYIQLTDLADLEHGTRIAVQLYGTLRCIGNLFSRFTSGGKTLNAELCHQCTQRFCGLWKLLWKHRSIIFTDKFTQVRHMFNLARWMLECHSSIDKEIHQHTLTTASYAAHVAFHIWCHADKPADDVHACARIVSDILKKQLLEGLQEFVHYVVPDVVGQKIALEVFCDALLADDKEILRPTQLHRHLSMSMFVLGRTSLSADSLSE